MSQRTNAIKLADAITSDANGDANKALRAAQNADFKFWEKAAANAGVEFPVAQNRNAVLTILGDRAGHPNPFDGFPS